MSQTEIKTPTRSSLPLSELRLLENPLHRYSSYMYNFTLAAVRITDVNKPESYMQKLDLIILKTGGKGTEGLNPNVTGITRKFGEEYTTVMEGAEVVNTKKRDIFQTDFTASALVEKFNEKSAGRFDMFIDNVEIETIMGPNDNSGVTLANSIKFEVVEPYSINGFIEALHVAAVAAGYLNYTQASFVLKMEFKGYPNTPVLSSAETVPLSTRYFLLGLTKVDVDLTEKGTRYRCTAVPYTEKALGQPNIIKSPVSMSGGTVEDILKNLCVNLNNLISNDDKITKTSSVNATKSDRYFVKFPTRNENDNSLNYNEVNAIGKSLLVSIDHTNKLFSFTDPGDPSQPVKNAYKVEGIKVQGKESSETKDMQVQFRENSRIHEIITSVIRDSEYLKNKLKNLKRNIDSFGYLDYFLIKTEITNDKDIDPVTRKPFQNFTFSVIPYKIHFTRIPGYADHKIDVNNFINIVLKNYNYIYTGQNLDITNFKLTFNNLYYEAMAKAFGNNDQPSSRFSSSEGTKTEIETVGSYLESIKKEVNGTPLFRIDATPTNVNQAGGNATQPNDDPYLVLARNMHNAVINSSVSLIQGELEIVGDPFYLVQAGISNYNPKKLNEYNRVNELGDVDHLFGEVLIRINFKNPSDIKSFQDGGLHNFTDEKVSFSGIYRVIKVSSVFSDGVFKQRLNIIRMPGQITDNSRPTDPGDRFVEQVIKEAGLFPGTI